MPTILTEDLACEWLFGDLAEERITEIASYQFPAGKWKLVRFLKILEAHWNRLHRLLVRICRPMNWYNNKRINTSSKSSQKLKTKIRILTKTCLPVCRYKLYIAK